MSMQKKKIQFQSGRDFMLKDEKEANVCRVFSSFPDRLTTP
jgi:hypothetical protein